MRNNFLLLIFIHLLVSCAPLSQVQDKSKLLAYTPQTKENTLTFRHLPSFIIEKPYKPYNRIGTPKAELMPSGEERIYVDTKQATIFTEERKFRTTKDTYTNLIYRVHFPETPYSLYPFQLGAGKNVGLLVIVTLNHLDQPVLYTTVQTCGCYLAIIPTTYLPQDAFPPNWPQEKQVIYSETLPALLNNRNEKLTEPTLMLLIRAASHRVKNIWLSEHSALFDFPTTTAPLQPMISLDNLPLNGSNSTTSFYETSGKRIGHVKGSYKHLEKLFVSWLALDWNIGEDKRLSEDRETPPVFFTSLKPWARNLSDLRDFPTFLAYWGWKL